MSQLQPAREAMLLNSFLHNFEEEKARRRVKDYLRDNNDGTSRAEFLGHFLGSVFQPILAVDGQYLRTIGYEAFIRPVAGDANISPLQYFEELQQEDQSFVDQLCRDLHLENFVKQALPQEFISINIAPQTLQDHIASFEGLKSHLENITSNKISQKSILLEIDITPELDAGVIYTFASQLSELGLGIVLENFDADCASFSRIVHCRPSVVKFNRSWLDANLKDRAYVELVANVVKGLHALGILAHLERIESPDELQFAIASGFDRVQGYCLGRPDQQLIRQTSNFTQ